MYFASLKEPFLFIFMLANSLLAKRGSSICRISLQILSVKGSPVKMIQSLSVRIWASLLEMLQLGQIHEPYFRFMPMRLQFAHQTPRRITSMGKAELAQSGSWKKGECAAMISAASICMSLKLSISFVGCRKQRELMRENR